VVGKSPFNSHDNKLTMHYYHGDSSLCRGACLSKKPSKHVISSCCCHLVCLWLLLPFYELVLFIINLPSYLHHFFNIYTRSLTNKQLWNYEIQGNGVSLYLTYVLILDFFTLSWSSLLLYLQLMFRVKYFLGGLAPKKKENISWY